jgi:flagellar motor switch protein FliN/FliY
VSDPTSALQQLGQSWLSRGEQDFGALLGPVSLSCRAFPLDAAFKAGLQPPWVAVVLEVEGSGDIVVLMKKRDAAVLVDVTIGGDGRVPSLDFSDLHLQVVEEFFSTMVGPLLDPVREATGRPLSLHVKDRRMDNVSAAIPNDGTVLEFTINTELMVDSALYCVLDGAASSTCADALGGGSQPGDEPPPAASAQLTPPPQGAMPVAAQPVPTPPMAMATAPAGGPQQYAGYPPQGPPGYPPQQPGWPQQPQAQGYPDPSQYNWGQQQQTGMAVGGPQQQRAGGPPMDEVTYQNVRLGQVTPQMPGAGARVESIRFLMDLPLKVTAVLGRSDIQIKDLLEMGVGSVLELDRYENEPVDLLVNDKLVARGEVVVVEDRFGIRITETISETERLKGIGG